MSSIRTTLAGAAAAVSSAALLLGGVTPAANADPASPPLPIDALQAPGLSAVQSLGPAIQQAAADPTNAASTLMAAAAVFAGDSAVPPESKNVATAVNQLVAHVPAPGAVSPGRWRICPRASTRYTPWGPRLRPHRWLPRFRKPRASTCPRPGACARIRRRLRQPHPAFGPDAPPTQDFMYPSISNGCLADGGNVLATAISVAGPAKIPAPGPAAGQTAYVFTAVGTPGAGGRAEAAAERHVGQPDDGQVGQCGAQAAAGHQRQRPDDVDGDRRHRLGQHHLDDLRPGHHDREAVPVHADDRLDGRPVAPSPRATVSARRHAVKSRTNAVARAEISGFYLTRMVIVRRNCGLERFPLFPSQIAYWRTSIIVAVFRRREGKRAYQQAN